MVGSTGTTDDQPAPSLAPDGPTRTGRSRGRRPRVSTAEDPVRTSTATAPSSPLAGQPRRRGRPRIAAVSDGVTSNRSAPSIRTASAIPSGSDGVTSSRTTPSIRTTSAIPSGSDSAMFASSTAASAANSGRPAGASPRPAASDARGADASSAEPRTAGDVSGTCPRSATDPSIPWPRPRGRPRRQPSPVRLCPRTGDVIDNIINSGTGNSVDFSLTIASRDAGNIPATVFDDAAHFFEKKATRGLVSLERGGGQKANLHVQGSLTLGIVKAYDDDKKMNTDVRNNLKTFESWGPDLRLKIDVKPLGAKQSFEAKVGYCSKDVGRGHFRTATMNVSRTEINVALAEYRKLQHQVVKDVRLELGKKNFWCCVRRFREEFLRPLTPSPVAILTWMVQDGEYLPSSSWICPTSAHPMEALRAEAYFVALVCPSLFRREHAYTLFFSGGSGGRVNESFALWDHQDAEWIELTCDQAKVHAGRRAEVADAVDAVRDLRNRRRASAAVADLRMPGVPNFPVGPDSDSDDGVQPACRPSAPTPTFRNAPGAPDDGTEDLPLLVHSSCSEPRCVTGGCIGMVPCAGSCDGLLHPTCGLSASTDDSRRTCSLCAGVTLGKRRSRT
ncbi:unnamed protein product [Sphacelaria rigidula]